MSDIELIEKMLQRAGITYTKNEGQPSVDLVWTITINRGFFDTILTFLQADGRLHAINIGEYE